MRPVHESTYGRDMARLVAFGMIEREIDEEEIGPWESLWDGIA